VKVLYIAGTGRSGTTLLDRILGQLDGFFSAGELENIWQRGVLADRRCGCGLAFSRCPTWTAILRRAFGGLDGVDATRMATLGRRHTGPRSIPATLAGRAGRGDPGAVAYREGLARLYQAVQQETGCGVIVDSSKSPLYAEQLKTLPDLDLYLLHLVRDPRATAHSFQRTKKLPDFGDERLMQQQAPLVSSRRWALWQAVIELLWRDRPGRYLRVRYEDFVRQPQRTVQRIAALVEEVPAELPFSSDSTVRMQPTHSVSGNPNRFTTGSVEVRADDEWVHLMRRTDRMLVTALTLPLLVYYRYPLLAPARRQGADLVRP
jgi:sulfotransferase family protein